jgi:hypothetical protein
MSCPGLRSPSKKEIPGLQLQRNRRLQDTRASLLLRVHLNIEDPVTRTVPIPKVGYRLDRQRPLSVSE